MSRLALASVLALTAATPVLADEVVVFAAASLKTALDQVAADWQAATGNTVTISYAGSNTLAQQIIQGAPADVFISAAENWMDAVAAEGLIVPDTRVDLLGNTLVLVAHGQAAPVQINAALDLPALLDGGKLAMAMVDSVPAGQYGKAALQNLGLWHAVQADVAQSENVRAALALVATGEAPLGIVYASDAIAEPGVTVIGTFPAESHKPITYPAALTTTAADPADADFLKALSDSAADAKFAAQGFVLLN
ncbi:MAG: molybdate ABC transporter substrate-binding protein [Rhodobacteraceae bacterium PARR1]|nr:MAG: molybdate ABC transporter substrate-binding protein [Rhodobacteraceae bacterium PARR1]